MAGILDDRSGGICKGISWGKGFDLRVGVLLYLFIDKPASACYNKVKSIDKNEGGILMKAWTDMGPTKIHYLHLSKGDDVLDCLRAMLREKDIRNGIVLTGIGTLNECQMHGVVTPEMPAKDDYFGWKGVPIEMAALSGIIADYEPHLHMVVTLYGKERVTYCGHIESGCKVLCLAEISILETTLPMRRTLDADRINQLAPIEQS